jgi:hypothetical protein
MGFRCTGCYTITLGPSSENRRDNFCPMGRAALMLRAGRQRLSAERRPASWRATASRWRTALVPWLLALSLAIQCTIVQGHFHPGGQASWAYAEGMPALVKAAKAGGDLFVAAPLGDSSGQRAPGCLLCEQMALAGSAILPEDAAPIHMAVAPGPDQISYQATSARSVVSHNWRSRAPPAFL